MFQAKESAEFFRANGYAILRNVISSEKLAGLHRRLVDEFHMAKKSGLLFLGGGMIAGHIRFWPGKEARFVLDYVYEIGQSMSRAFFGKALESAGLSGNLNLPDSTLQQYHRDCARLSDDFLILNIPTVDVSVDNGAMEVIPRSHTCQSYWRFTVERRSRDSMCVLVKRGDVLIRSASLWHRGTVNRTPDLRFMIAVGFQKKGHSNARSLDFPISFANNAYRMDAIGQRIEQAAVDHPKAMAAYRFISSFLGAETANVQNPFGE